MLCYVMVEANAAKVVGAASSGAFLVWIWIYQFTVSIIFRGPGQLSRHCEQVLVT